MSRLFLVSVIVLAACPAQPPPEPPKPPELVVTQPPPVPPVPPPAPANDEPPKLRLPRIWKPTNYTAKLALDPSKPTFDGAIAIDGTVDTATSVIWLHAYHLTIHTATAVQGGVTIALTATPRGDELVELRADHPLEPGTWQLALAYTGEVDPVTTLGAFKEIAVGNGYIFTQFESIGARRVFPCLDEPDSKVPWQLSIDVPKGNIAVSNTIVAHDSALPDGGHHYEFAQTKPLPSYLIAFGVGPFDLVPAGQTKSGVPVRIVVPKGRAPEAAYAAQNTAHIVDLLEAWFGIPYAFGKLDLMAIPLTSGFGAMENAGLVTFSESLVLVDPQRPSWERRERFVQVAAHELAHQWFGDLVTTAWWDDIWLNEGFADWMETKITAQFDPSWHIELDEIRGRERAQKADSIVTARKIRQSIENENDILNAFDGITYNKGASVLRMFETFVGPEVFRTGVRAYLNDKKFGNATSADFVAAIGKAANKDLAPAFATFLDQPGLPQLDFEIACDAHGNRVTIGQQRFIGDGAPPAEPTKPWLVPVCVAFDKNGARAEACTMLDGPKGTLALDTRSCPRWIVPNVGGRGYYRVDLTVKQASALRDEAWAMMTPSERLVTFFDVEVSATQAHAGTKLPIALAISFIPKLLAAGDRFSIEEVRGLVDDTLAFFALADQRPKLEAWLRATFGPGATKLGPLPKDGDDIDAEASRSDLFIETAFRGRDPDLVKQAIELAGHWRDLPEAMRGDILDVAVDASPDLQAKLRSDVKTEKDDRKLREELEALGRIRDPARLQDALGVMLDPAVDFRRSMWMLTDASDVTRDTRQAFFRTHQAELMKRLPPIDDTGTSVYAFAVPFAQDCDASRRDEIVDFMTKSFSAIPGAPRRLVQLTEQLDRCIATKKVLEPEVRGWLGGVKITKSAKPAKLKP